MLKELNKDRLDGLAKPCFDLAKGAFALSILSATNVANNLLIQIGKILLGLFWGIAFTYLGLLFLKRKEKAKK